jgi:hypothetical protein
VGGAGGNGVLVTLFKDGRRVEMHAGAALAARFPPDALVALQRERGPYPRCKTGKCV